MLQELSRTPILFYNTEGNVTGSYKQAANTNEDVDTHKNIPFLTLGSKVVVQNKDAGSWTHRTRV